MLIEEKSTGEEDFQGNNSGQLIARLEAILGTYSDGGPAGHEIEGAAASVVESAGNDLTDLLRWERQHSKAISLQLRLSQMLPGQSQRFRISAATLTIEAGQVEQGLRLLRSEAALMEPVEGRHLLASTLTWLQQYATAATMFGETVSDVTASSTDRAAAAYAQFQLLNLLGKLPQAIEAWKVAATLDPSYAATLPELVRAQIYWRDFDGAIKSVAGDPSEIRRSFYRDLVAARTIPTLGRTHWNWVSDQKKSSIDEAPEEFAEAALRNRSPQLALDVLVPFIDRQNLSRRRLVLTGLAWGQLRQVDRARWALQVALRLAEIERPRVTRQGTTTTRIFDAETRIAYGEIPIDADVRRYLDHFFMPEGFPTPLPHREGGSTTASDKNAAP